MSLVDEEAYKIAKVKNDSILIDAYVFLETYEQAKLDKANVRESMAVEHDMVLSGLETGMGIYDRKPKPALPALPVLISKEFWQSVDYSRYTNQLITCLQAVYKELQERK